MDHGILNVPLAKRGDIDKQIDRYKKEQAQAERVKDKALASRKRELVAMAKTHVESLSDERLAGLAVKFGKTKKQTKDYLLAQAFWQPALIIKL
jgi:hypothetical protein